MTLTIIIIVFVLGYLAIALEHPLKIDKAASALITGVVCWALYVLGTDQIAPHLEEAFREWSHSPETTHPVLAYFFEHRLLHHVSEIASILFFLMGAMTIVETVDAHEGFAIITDRITTTNKVKLMWIICIIAFFFSAALDNLTTTIVMISLLRKLIKDKQTRWLFVGMVVLAANAGGAWSPIGDVTTTMLWIKGQLPSVPSMIENLIIPSLAAIVVPLLILSFTLRGSIERPEVNQNNHTYNLTKLERNIIFFLGLAGLVFVPIFKTITHLPPFMGMMLSLGIVWAVTEVMHRGKEKKVRKGFTVIGVLQKIDVASVLFFLGILLAVSALQEVGYLRTVAGTLDQTFKGNIFSINIIIGLLSAIVDNVPLVAAAQGMYEITPSGNFAADGTFWQFLAYCAGTGGSALIIGSAAGVAAMGLEKIDFGWYLKKISWLAIVGYFSGVGVFMLMHST